MELEAPQSQKEFLRQGAEAKVYLQEFLGELAIVKEKVVKRYRLPELDLKLSRQRIQQEVKNMAKARKSGINTPYILFVNLNERKIYMQYVRGKTARDYLHALRAEQQPDDTLQNQMRVHYLLRDIASNIAKLHKNKIVHGDLTTSNIIVKPHDVDSYKSQETPYGCLYIIDFGLSEAAMRPKDYAIDLYVLEKAFVSTHPELENDFPVLLKEYEILAPNGKETIAELDKQRMLGRKKVAFG